MSHSSVQDYVVKPVRAAAILTGSYVAGTVLGTDLQLQQQNQLKILVKFTIGNLTSGEVKVEFSPDNSTWYQETFSSISTVKDTMSLGEHSMAATGNYCIALPIKDRYVRISSKGTGADPTGSSMTVDAIIGTN